MTEHRLEPGQLPAYVREALSEAGVSQVDVAFRLGVTTKHVNQLLGGKAPLTVEQADRMVSLCGKRLVISAHTVADPVVRREDISKPTKRAYGRPCEAEGCGEPSVGWRYLGKANRWIPACACDLRSSGVPKRFRLWDTDLATPVISGEQGVV